MPETQAFIDRWRGSEASETSNFQPFVYELCNLLGVPHTDPANATTATNAYVFERRVTFNHGDGHTSTGFIDLYKRGCFVMEGKQGSSPTQASPLFGAAPTPGRRGTARRGTSSWDTAMQRAKNQAEGYVRALPTTEGRPPFIIIVDVGHSIELYSEFSRTGGNYVAFPDPQRHRILLEDLHEEQTLRMLRAVWTDPLSLDPTRISARVTRDIAAKLALLARSLEGSGHEPGEVAGFLMRALFTMFAEDVKLLPSNSFRDLLTSLREDTEHFQSVLEPLWQTMNTGGYSLNLRKELLRFNGGLFADPEVLPVTEEQLELLVQAAEADWREVEPAIFGTLLERALDPRERHKLGAHYTPRAYVERLVMPTIIEPLRSEWQSVIVAATQLRLKGDEREAVKTVRQFHQRLCSLRVLDPACGSGNFLYVTLEHLKRLEGEVLEALADLSGNDQLSLEMQGTTVTPEQFLGLEVNPRAAKIAELVLWIGYLQWHFRTRGDVLPPEPVIRDFHNIENRDAVLSYDGVEPLLDDGGDPVTRWDGRTFKLHPVTGEPVPDETARAGELRYLNPEKATWPKTDYIVGNPPFVGTARMREALGDGYTEALRKTYKDVPETSDFVMYWWHHAAELARANKVLRFGFITTNSLRQTFNRKVLQHHLSAKNPLSLRFAVPDHPWVDTADGAAVRVAMTVGEAGESDGVLKRVVSERETNGLAHLVLFNEEQGKIFPDLSTGADVSGTVSLEGNSAVSSRGMELRGSGFIVTEEEAEDLGLGRLEGLEKHIRTYVNGRDITQTSRNAKVIDLFSLDIEDVKANYPDVYQWVLTRVKPERDQNRRAASKKYWWVFGEARANFRPALEGLQRYIATVETSKHRFFVFLDKTILPDNKLVNIALEDAYFLGVLSSRVHVTWALAAGSRLGVGNDPVYVKTTCFEKFPFPEADDAQKQSVRELGEALDDHRKRQQAQHLRLTMTGMYNVLEKLRAGEPLDENERAVHEQGLVSVLKELHDELDKAVAAAYGWPANLPDGEILGRLVALNLKRAAEEAQGNIQWLRPAYQNPEGTAQQGGIGLDTPEATIIPAGRQPWPRTLPEQVSAVRGVVAGLTQPGSSREVAQRFKGARVDKVDELLETLVMLGQVRSIGGDRYAA